MAPAVLLVLCAMAAMREPAVDSMAASMSVMTKRRTCCSVGQVSKGEERSKENVAYHEENEGRRSTDDDGEDHRVRDGRRGIGDLLDHL